MDDSIETLTCKFTSEIENQHGRYIVEIPENEIEYGTLSTGDVCQISVQKVENADTTETTPGTDSNGQTPPVTEGERHTVEIEDLGEQGDGIARVDRGYVLIIPGTDLGDEVTVEIKQTNQNYGFAEVVDTEATREMSDA